MGVAVTFIALLELLREQVIELVQGEPYSPIHVRAATGARETGEGETGETDEGEAALEPAAPAID